MGWFGILASLFSGGVYATGKIKELQYDKQSRDRALQNDSYTYMDGHGYHHLTSNNEQVYYHRGKIYSVKTGQLLKDTNEEYFNKRNEDSIRDARANNQKYANLIYAKNGNWDKRYMCKTELDTMKKYEVTYFPKYGTYEWLYVFRYLEYDGYLKPIDSKFITRQEF